MMHSINNRFFRNFAMRSGVVLSALVLTSSFVFSQEFEKITNVSVKAESADTLSVAVDMTAPANYYLFKISNPPRLVIEFTSTMVEAEKKEIDVKDCFIKKVRVGQYKDAPIKIARIVFDLPTDEVYYDALSAGDQILVSISSKSGKAVVKIPSMIQQKKSAAKSAIERNVPTPDHKSKVKEIKETGETVAPEAADTPVEPMGEMTTHGGVLQISKKIISVNFYQTDIRTILRAVSEQTGINIIYGSDVQSNVTLKLKDVTFDDALRIILKMSGLVVEKEAENIIRIITPAALKDERSRSVQFTRVLPLKYTRAADIKTQLTAIKVEGIAATIGEDPLTNSIVLTTTPEGITKYQELISIFDVKPRQVLIEASIMEVGYSDGLNLGIAWQSSGFNAYNKDANNLVKGAVQNSPAATPGTSGLPALNTTSIGLSLAVGGLINSNQFSALIEALQQKGKAKTLATPKIVTMNNVQASILSGDQVPYAQTTVSAAGSTQTTEFTNVGIQLDVTPTIHSDEYVTLEVKPKVSSYQMSTAGPIITTREANTTVMVKSNETVVIGGLINEKDLEAVEQMPILGDLPILGYLFKRHQSSKDRVELLVFLKPIILD
ncbi:MAG: secretin and TonB N-terminal domain-containing protein [Candidatus Omnitrophota bacterium]|nr:AMIN domain-containing protein [Candidatus Omnitrophota bacterium]MBU2528264.1 AMIN domain-containing protein [bacterium]MBU3929641.1 AMIN domain-containing protein [bacterium]MBU4122125.1 AMIN domain-containing protein [bacterium]